MRLSKQLRKKRKLAILLERFVLRSKSNMVIPATHPQYSTFSALKEDRTQVDNLLVNFDAGIIWKIFTIFYWNILSWILWNLDKKCSEPFCTEPNFYLTSKIDFDKNVKVKLIFAVVKIISIIDGSEQTFD